MAKKKITISINQQLLDDLAKCLPNYGFSVSAKITMAIADYNTKHLKIDNKKPKKEIEEPTYNWNVCRECSTTYDLNTSESCPTCSQ